MSSLPGPYPSVRLTSSINANRGGMFALNRLAAKKDSGGGKSFHPASSYTEQLRRNAIGRSSYKTPVFNAAGVITGYANTQSTNYTSGANKTTVNRHLARARGGGAIAPAKKGAVANGFRSGGGSRITGTGNRTAPRW